MKQDSLEFWESILLLRKSRSEVALILLDALEFFFNDMNEKEHVQIIKKPSLQVT